jgi:hypothetical protein
VSPGGSVQVRTHIHEIVVSQIRLRQERDRATGRYVYFVNDQPCDVNAYLAVTQAHLDRADANLRGCFPVSVPRITV